jgi:para-nitrobenzyl esterase
VFVYFHGGGLSTGDGSEPRHDGEQLALTGIVVVTANYRLGIFGFLAHEQLRGEAGRQGSGNYGLLDQVAVLRWVQTHVAAFGGNPARVTIAGPSAGSESVHALVASPLAKSLIAGAIGSSGALVPPARALPVPLQDAERFGADFLDAQRIASTAALRELSADDLFARSMAFQREKVSRFPIAIDGMLLPRSPSDIYASGAQAHVPLLVGSNSREQDERAVLGRDAPTRENYERALQRMYGERSGEALRAYPAASPSEVVQAAADMATDRFMGYPMWKWADVHARTTKAPVFRYVYTHPRPARSDASQGTRPSGAGHGDEIEYAFGTLDSTPSHAWTPTDRAVSNALLEAYASFVKTGRPRVPGLEWPSHRQPAWPVMYVGAQSHVMTDPHRARYLFLDSVFAREEKP